MWRTRYAPRSIRAACAFGVSGVDVARAAIPETRTALSAENITIDRFRFIRCPPIREMKSTDVGDSATLNVPYEDLNDSYRHLKNSLNGGYTRIDPGEDRFADRSEEHTSELQSLAYL